MSIMKRMFRVDVTLNKKTTSHWYPTFDEANKARMALIRMVNAFSIDPRLKGNQWRNTDIYQNKTITFESYDWKKDNDETKKCTVKLENKQISNVIVPNKNK